MLPDHGRQDVGTDGAEEGVRLPFVEHLHGLQGAEGGAALSVSHLGGTYTYQLLRERLVHCTVTKLISGPFFYLVFGPQNRTELALSLNERFCV